ncbi:hypothetical protein ASE98_11450 [Pseudomonas sp. Leaf48]|nr:hypothetical protein ASE98_11450 [Pseudomonas sp. Leaf48]
MFCDKDKDAPSDQWVQEGSYATLVGAGLLAMDANDDTGLLYAHGALRLFASVLAPAGERAEL